MNLKHIKNLVVVTGKYTNSQGEEKNEYRTIGKMFKRDDDSVTIKIDALPIGGEWSGWVNLYDPKPREDTNPGQKAMDNVEKPPKGTSEDLEDQLPF